MKPWRRSWRATGSFALLSPLTRAVFREIFTELVEDDGTMTLGARPLGDEVCRRLGVERHERRVVRRCVEELLSDGCIVVRDGVASLPGWDRYQAEGATTKTARKRSSAKPLPSSVEPVTDLCGSSADPLTDLCVTSDGSGDEAKSMESFNTTRTEERRGEERRESVSHSHGPRPRRRSSIDCPDPLGEHETVSSAELPWRMWVAAARKRGMRLTDTERSRELRHVEDIERRVLELVPEVAQARGMEPGDAARSLVALAYRRFGELYDAEHTKGSGGQTKLAWRLAFVVARWAELTKDAIPAGAETRGGH